MGRIGRTDNSNINDGNLREITTEVYSGFTEKSRQITTPGIDSCPVVEDQGVLISIDQTKGKTVQIGVYPDPQTQPGEVRIYSRDSSGSQKAEMWIKNDGKIYFNSGTNPAARKEDPTLIDTTTDNAFISWISQITAAVNGLTGGSIVPPTQAIGKINDGTEEVLLP